MCESTTFSSIISDYIISLSSRQSPQLFATTMESIFKQDTNSRSIFSHFLKSSRASDSFWNIHSSFLLDNFTRDYFRKFPEKGIIALVNDPRKYVHEIEILHDRLDIPEEVIRWLMDNNYQRKAVDLVNTQIVSPELQDYILTNLQRRNPNTFKFAIKQVIADNGRFAIHSDFKFRIRLNENMEYFSVIHNNETDEEYGNLQDLSMFQEMVMDYPDDIKLRTFWKELVQEYNLQTMGGFDPLSII